MSLTVACVLSAGPTYNRSHVERLERMIATHMLQPYRFVCVDDSPFQGFWSKVSLFQTGRFSGRVLYLDLDVTVIGSLDDLAGPLPIPTPDQLIRHGMPWRLCVQYYAG